ncbi:hypothetical protein MNEG_10746, partial [Monoraphidium neglectum]
TIAAGLADRNATGHGRARSSGGGAAPMGVSGAGATPPAAKWPHLAGLACPPRVPSPSPTPRRRAPQGASLRRSPRARYPAPSDEERYTAAGAAERWRTLGRAR